MKEKYQNDVTIEGYLKESKLKVEVFQGKTVIKGSLIVATNENRSYVVDFFANKFKDNGETTKSFKDLENLLPEKVNSIATYLTANETADFATAAANSAKVWCYGGFDEYTTYDDNKEEYQISKIRGVSAGFVDRQLKPKARFETDVYIEEINNAKQDDGSVQVELIGYIPNYKKDNCTKVKFITGDEDIAGYIKLNYHKGETTNINGEIINIMERKRINSGEIRRFGVQPEVKYETKFITSYVIDGGNETTWGTGHNFAIPEDAIENMKANRLTKIRENTNKKKDKTATAEAAAAAEQATLPGLEGNASAATNTKKSWDFDMDV